MAKPELKKCGLYISHLLVMEVFRKKSIFQ
jgi:hypothetical protein